MSCRHPWIGCPRQQIQFDEFPLYTWAIFLFYHLFFADLLEGFGPCLEVFFDISALVWMWSTYDRWLCRVECVIPIICLVNLWKPFRARFKQRCLINELTLNGVTLTSDKSILYLWGEEILFRALYL